MVATVKEVFTAINKVISTGSIYLFSIFIPLIPRIHPCLCYHRNSHPLVSGCDPLKGVFS